MMPIFCFLTFKRWGVSKLIETYLRWNLPLKKYGMVPKFSFLEDFSSCQIAMLPDKFYDRVEEGSIIIKNSHNLSFCEEGLIIDGENRPIETDVVIFATGFKGDEKLRNIFESPVFKNNIMGSPTATVSLYRSFVNFLSLAIYLSVRSLNCSMNNTSSLIFHGWC